METVAIIVIFLFVAGIISYLARKTGVALFFLLLGFVISLLAFGLVQ